LREFEQVDGAKVERGEFFRRLLTQPRWLLEYLIPERHGSVQELIRANQGFLFFDNLVVDPKSIFVSQHKTVQMALGRSLLTGERPRVF
jgi:hypothetical protein